MTNNKIVNARWAIGEGGLACGPVCGPVVAEVELLDEKTNVTSFFSGCEIEDSFIMYKTNTSTIDAQVKSYDEDDESEAFYSMMEKYKVLEYTYDDLLDNVDIDKEPVLRYLLYIVRAYADETDEYIAATKGKILEKIKIPASDIEDNWENDEMWFRKELLWHRLTMIRNAVLPVNAGLAIENLTDLIM